MDSFKLDQFQIDAIEAAKQNSSVIVSAPTGAGKTLIAEYIIEDCLQNNKGIIYTAPIKALSNQKFRDFSYKYPQKVGILTGDVSINREAPILIMTTEIFRNAILVNPAEFEKREWVIFDEIHYLDDIERGTVWEEAIILLPAQMKMLALSATIPNINEFTDWLKKVHSFPVKTIIENKRPVPLHFLFQCNNEIFNNFESIKKSNLLRQNLSRRSYSDNYEFSKPNRLKTILNQLNISKAYPCIYFSFSRRRCEELSKEVSYFDLLSSNEKKEITNAFQILIDKFDITSSPHINFLAPMIRKGIAYHHAGLLPTVKEVIERLFTTGLIKLIFTTETFALGINMPAKTVIFDSLSKFYGRYHNYLKTRDFYQMAGRSGRRGIDKEGFVYSRINPWQISLNNLENIIYGNYEPIKSQLNSCYATILNLYKIMKDKIYDIYPNSFHFHQSKSWEKENTLLLLKRKISLLKDLGYITADKLSPKGYLASRVYSFELTIGELFEKGLLDSLDEKDLFILITALVYEPRKGEKRPKLNKRIKVFNRQLNRLLKDIHKKEHSLHIYPLSKRFYFYLSDISKMWIEGASFSKINQYSGVDEGEVVRYFRMAIQVLREIYSCEVISNILKIKIGNCLRIVNRDVIDAEKQLRQDIT
ncbi:MAG: DEAD/DEAH box helicase [Candidatus Omnitrophica bacterium]|jgi:superfamily II RNA helicase|nr:DEAD/DEAH box helicase [Candidatus Omnitrophota bacterium]